jgi:hypothetical protein
MSKKNYHVTKRPDGNWQGRAEGAKRASVVTPTQREAIKETRPLVKEGELVIHGRDNLIRDKDTHGKDPYPPKG